jgi:hypothetical protein
MDRAREIGDLCIAGDWACVHGDLPGLADVAARLAAFVDEPLHCELAHLGELCRTDLHRAVAQWPQLRDRMFDEEAHPSP